MDDQKPEPALEAFKPLEHFCKAMLDGFVVVNTEGKVLKSSAMIAAMSGLTSKQILKSESLDEVFDLFLGDKKLTVKELLANTVPTRVDEVRTRAGGSKELTLILGYYPFLSGDNVIGAWILMRDVTAENALQGKYKDKAAKSITDPMTGLLNRAYFEEYLIQQENQLGLLPHDSEHRKLSVIMGDIDHFKRVNDKYGHPAGDYVIKTVSNLMQKAFRKTDVVCRYGGEEFLIILPASDLDGASVAADKVRQMIESFTFEHNGEIIPVTLSSGVAQLNVGNETGKDAIARADAALYHSKQNGRNQVSLHMGFGIAKFEIRAIELPKTAS